MAQKTLLPILALCFAVVTLGKLHDPTAVAAKNHQIENKLNFMFPTTTARNLQFEDDIENGAPEGYKLGLCEGDVSAAKWLNGRKVDQRDTSNMYYPSSQLMPAFAVAAKTVRS